MTKTEIMFLIKHMDVQMELLMTTMGAQFGLINDRLDAQNDRLDAQTARMDTMMDMLADLQRHHHDDDGNVVI